MFFPTCPKAAENLRKDMIRTQKELVKLGVFTAKEIKDMNNIQVKIDDRDQIQIVVYNSLQSVTHVLGVRRTRPDFCTIADKNMLVD